MTNGQVYRKTLSFSLLMFLIGIINFAVVIGLTTAGFFIFQAINPDLALIGLPVGLVVGIIVIALVNIFITNRVKAAQISMMVKGVTEDKLPEHTFKEGFNELRGRFAKITVFFFITNSIKNIFRQIGRTFTRVGQAVGGNVGGSVTSAIDSAVQTLIAYLCDCCLGWILYRKEVNAFKAACEGTVIFFKHGKTLARNVGRIFGMGLLSLLLIGGIIGGGSYLIFLQFPQMFQELANQIAATGSEGSEVPVFLTNPTTLMIAVAVLVGVVLWSVIHSVLIRPFILVGVLRNYMAAGLADIPVESDFAALDSRSPRFAKLRSRAEE